MLLVAFAVGAGAAGENFLASVLFLLMIVFLFMARHPLSLWLKTRLRNEEAGRGLLLWAGIYLSLMLLSTITLLYLQQRWLLLPLGILAGMVLFLHLYLLWHRKDRTAWGELLEIAGLSLAAPGAYYAATGHLGQTALMLGMLAFLYSGSSVFYVKMKVRQRSWRGQAPSLRQRWELGRSTFLYQLGLIALLSALALGGKIPPLAPGAFLPLVLKNLWGVFFSRGRSTIRQVGITELGHAVLFTLLLILIY
jgi:4-hydroxybenzoate polyprenyltransferase